ncbi:MAG: hypothetical protein KGS45_02085 [Planctomycetes bacterium]|nr:hypothetical protein [Planctomycetota bacterium]
MKSFRNDELCDQCTQIQEGDGINPREESLKERQKENRERAERTNYRDQALAKQAARVIDQELASRASSIGCDLGVSHIEVSASGAHVRAWVSSLQHPDDPSSVERWLQAFAPFLRVRLGAVLARKRVPTLKLVFAADAPAIERQSQGQTDSPVGEHQ